MALKVVHKFLRNPYYESDSYHRIANRHSLDNLTRLLSGSGKEILLVGTANSSSLLAERTRRAAEAFKPDEVYVQAQPEWWQVAKHVNTDSQAEFNTYFLPRSSWNIPNNPRGLLFKAKLYSWMAGASLFFKLPGSFKVLTPGLETLKALKVGQKLGAKLTFGGEEVDQQAIENLRRNSRLNFWQPLFNFYRLPSNYSRETWLFLSCLETRGSEAFSQSIDQSRANFMNAMLSKVLGDIKRELVDRRDQRIFKELYNSKSKRILAVVNAFHYSGVRQLWEHSHGQTEHEDVNPVGDMDINALQESDLINDALRNYYSKVTKSEPSTWNNYINQYHKDVQEPERNRHVIFDSHEDIDDHGHVKGHH